MHEDGRQLGRKPMRASHLTKYPTDAVIDATIQAQLEAEIEAEEAAARASGHLPSRARCSSDVLCDWPICHGSQGSPLSRCSLSLAASTVARVCQGPLQLSIETHDFSQR